MDSAAATVEVVVVVVVEVEVVVVVVVVVEVVVEVEGTPGEKNEVRQKGKLPGSTGATSSVQREGSSFSGMPSIVTL